MTKGNDLSTEIKFTTIFNMMFGGTNVKAVSGKRAAKFSHHIYKYRCEIAVYNHISGKPYMLFYKERDDHFTVTTIGDGRKYGVNCHIQHLIRFVLDSSIEGFERPTKLTESFFYMPNDK